MISFASLREGVRLLNSVFLNHVNYSGYKLWRNKYLNMSLYDITQLITIANSIN